MIDFTLTEREREFLKLMLDGDGRFDWYAGWLDPRCGAAITLERRGYVTNQKRTDSPQRVLWVATLTDKGRKVAEATVGGQR